MTIEIELEIIYSAMKFIKMDGGYILENSSKAYTSDDKFLSWEDAYSKNSFISDFLHSDWIKKNENPISLNSLSEKIKIHFLSLEKFDKFQNLPDKAWSNFYKITRPGISSDEKSAILVVTAKCPSGSPNYSSILFLEKSVHFWNVKSTHGIYSK